MTIKDGYASSISDLMEAYAQEKNEQLMEVLDLIMSEINSSPMSVQFFDLRIIKQANEILNTKKWITKQ